MTPLFVAGPKRVEAAGNKPKYVAVCLPAFSPATVHRDKG